MRNATLKNKYWNYPFTSCKETPVIMNPTRLKGGISELLPEGAIFNNPKCNLG